MGGQIAYSQDIVYREAKPFSFYFERNNPNYAPLFDLLDSCPQDAFIKYYVDLQIEIFRQNGTDSIDLKFFTKGADCLCRYRNFLIGDFIFVENFTVEFIHYDYYIPIREVNIENYRISDKDTFFDANFIPADIQFTISEIEYRIGEEEYELFKQGLKRIDNYFLFDSLWNNWLQQIDYLDLSNVDMLPIYQFKLKDIATEIKKYDSNEYEVLLSKSGLDNRDYLQKRAVLFKKIEDLTLSLSQKIAAMDELMFEKAKQFEDEQSIDRAIFYYNRTLDYNPLHCDALERLSDLYTRQNLHKENLELFTNLRIRGEDISCEAALTSSVCDSMCLKASHLIEQRNFYDAIKFLDTLELMFHQMAGDACLQTYLSLRKQAQEGIYNSYIDVINRGIRENKIDLCKEYIYGLVAIMEKDKNLPSDNQSFTQMMERFISRYRENVKNVVKKKKYDEAIRGNDAMLVFLDSIRYGKNKELFFDSYSISCNEIYREKRKRSEEEATAFFNIYGKYITFSEEYKIPENQEFVQELNDENKYEFLVNYVLAWNISADDFSMLDTVISLLQWEIEKEYTKSAIDSSFVEKKINPLIMSALNKVEHYAWINEFSSATMLIKKIDNIFPLLDLSDETNSISSKYKETTELLQQRINERAEKEYTAFSLKIKELEQQKQYFQAYHLLKTENLYLQKTIYQNPINQLLKEVEIPAVFQEKMVSVEQNLALGDFTSAFSEYEEAFSYFQKNNLSQYGLICDSLYIFVKASKRESLLKAACHYYTDSANYLNALGVMMYLVDLGYKCDDVQAKLGLAMRKSSYRLADISENHSFTKAHKPFLQNFLGKFGYFWYTITK